MIKLEHVVLPSAGQIQFVIEGMRNPMNSWDKSDSYENFEVDYDKETGAEVHYPYYRVGAGDISFMKRLSKAGTDHRKFMRMMPVYVRITAPLYWWKEADTYKIGTVSNSCSTIHKIQDKEFTLDDFSHENLVNTNLLENIVNELNVHRDIYNSYDNQSDSFKAKFSKKDIWWQLIQLIPSSYNQTRNVMLNYEVLFNMYHSRKSHKLDEWREFCEWIKNLPYSELIILEG